MRFAYCPATGEEPSEVRTQIKTAGGNSIFVTLDGEGRPVIAYAQGSKVPLDPAEFAERIPDSPEIATLDGEPCEWRWRFGAEQDAQGRLLLHMGKVAAVLPGHSRYNGGGVKRITRIDRSKTDGWSLIGEYCPDRADWQVPGLYLDISKAGSRKSVNTNYQLFRLCADGTIVALESSSTGRDGKSWATALWPAIDRELADLNANAAWRAAWRDVFRLAEEEREEFSVSEERGNAESAADEVGPEYRAAMDQQDEDDDSIRMFVRLMRRLQPGEREHAYGVITAAIMTGCCLDCGGSGGEEQADCQACSGTGRLDDTGAVSLAGAGA